MVLNPTAAPNTSGQPGPSQQTSSRAKQLNELASQLGDEVQRIRANEGEAANYGVFYDDTEYDYMQHLRDLGTGGGEAVFVEAQSVTNQKQKQKQSLADAIKDGAAPPLLDEDILPSKTLQKVTYQNQQDVPDAIAGFQPDMDPRLREALEALEDEAYVDNGDGDGEAAEGDEVDDLFMELAKDSEELDADEFEETYDDGEYYDDYDEDGGWESDVTEKPAPRKAGQSDEAGESVPELVDTSGSASTPPAEPMEGADGPSDDWMEDFRKFKKEQLARQQQPSGAAARTKAAAADVQSSVWTTTTHGGRKKKRKGALTQQSGFSMTSSSLVRTEQLTLLDARFEKIDEEYNGGGDDEDDEDDERELGGDMRSVSGMSRVSGVSGLSTASSVQGPLRSDFDGIMDEFLGGYSMQGKRAVKKGRQQSGLEQLEEIRRGLGPARIPTRRK